MDHGYSLLTLQVNEYIAWWLGSHTIWHISDSQGWVSEQGKSRRCCLRWGAPERSRLCLTLPSSVLRLPALSSSSFYRKQQCAGVHVSEGTPGNVVLWSSIRACWEEMSFDFFATANMKLFAHSTQPGHLWQKMGWHHLSAAANINCSSGALPTARASRARLYGRKGEGWGRSRESMGGTVAPCFPQCSSAAPDTWVPHRVHTTPWEQLMRTGFKVHEAGENTHLLSPTPSFPSILIGTPPARPFTTYASEHRKGRPACRCHHPWLTWGWRGAPQLLLPRSSWGCREQLHEEPDLAEDSSSGNRGWVPSSCSVPLRVPCRYGSQHREGDTAYHCHCPWPSPAPSTALGGAGQKRSGQWW